MTSFEEKVYCAVSRIPKGKVATYREIARAIRRPRASRAVGNALKKNPDLIRIPCHRVIAATGSVGGYRGGTKKKIVLLQKEGVEVAYGRVPLSSFFTFPSRTRQSC